MPDNDMREYVVRYPDGNQLRLQANCLASGEDGSVTLLQYADARAGSTVFYATPASGVTVYQVNATDPEN